MERNDTCTMELYFYGSDSDGGTCFGTYTTGMKTERFQANFQGKETDLEGKDMTNCGNA